MPLSAGRIRAGLCAVLLTLLVSPAPAAALDLDPGDLVVSNTYAQTILRVTPRNGATHVISSNSKSTLAGGGAFLSFPFGLAFAGNGDVLVADRDAFGGTGGVIRIDSSDGAQTEVSSNATSLAAGGEAVFDQPGAIVRGAHGKLFTTDFGSTPNVAKVDPANGKATALSSGGGLVKPWGMTMAAGGLMVADAEAFGGHGGVIRVDSKSGHQRVISKGGRFREPYGVVPARHGKLYVTDTEAFPGVHGGVIGVDPRDGSQTKVSAGGNFVDPAGIGKEAGGDLVVTDFGAGALVRVHPKSGHQHVIRPGLQSPLDVEVVPRRR